MEESGNVRRMWWWWHRKFFFWLYYALARWLPAGIAPMGSLGVWLRGWCARNLFARCGHGVIVDRGAWFREGGSVSLGDRSNIGINANINGYVTIGNDVLMGPDVIIMSRNHRIDCVDIPIRAQGYEDQRPVRIGNDVWIGARVVILPGVTIGDGAVVGAGAVVSKDVPSLGIAVGVPAAVKRFRGDSFKGA